MDCGKDFYGEEYAEHTSCISEAEKYQGALFKGEKGGGTKGEKKQQQWIQVGCSCVRLFAIFIIDFALRISEECYQQGNFLQGLQICLVKF